MPSNRNSAKKRVSPLLSAFLQHRVGARVVDVDHYRIRGGMAVETDYIIRVQPIKGDGTRGRKSKKKCTVPPNNNGRLVDGDMDMNGDDDESYDDPGDFGVFMLSKTYSAFRTLGHQLKKAADKVTSKADPLPIAVQRAAQYAETFFHLVEGQRPEYLGKVNYNYVKLLAKKRGQIVNETLEATLSYFPKETESHPFLAKVAEMIETFFLLDHCEEVDDLPDMTMTTPSRPSMPLKAATIETTPGRSISLNSSTIRLGGSITGSIFKSQKKITHRKNQLSVEDETTSLAILHYVNNVATPEKLKQQQPESENPLPSIIPFKLDEAAGKIGSLIQKAWPGVGDDVVEQPKKNPQPHLDNSGSFHKSARSLISPVVPYTRKPRRSLSKRVLDDEELEDVGSEANLLLDDDRPSTELVPNYSRPVPNFQSPGTKLGDLLANNPVIFVLIAAVVVSLLRHAANLSVTMDLDIQLLLIFASFCIGLHTPRPMIGGIDKTTGPMTPLSPINTTMVRRSSIQRGGLQRKDQSGRLLLRRAMSITTTPTANSPDGPHSNRFSNGATSTTYFGTVNDDDLEDEMDNNDDDDDEEGILQVNRSPMPRFPEGAALGSHLNCWSEPVAKDFQVRGPKYLWDRKKVPSPGFVFPVRGVDLFLTDSCPENAGSNTAVYGGNLRDIPTFIINFRLPWGILLCYWEIPKRFLPFVRAGYEPDFDESTLPSLDNMAPRDRCVARFLKGSDQEKNSTLKIVPRVVEGPWVVKSVVGGKPAIIGNKVPVHWVYQRAEAGKALYLEADLDIVASSAARGILSVARTYTQVLTIDLGFVVQGNTDDELPEEMLVGARLHGIDPMSAPPLPLSKDMFAVKDDNDAEDPGDE